MLVRKLKNIFNGDRKILYMILSIVLISIFSLTIVYAALSVTLNIAGNAEVVAADWDIHLDNVKVTSGSVNETVPFITSPTTATFSAELAIPGDFYEFTIDVVNDGTIDAMIDSVVKTPTLTATQAKYLNYIVEYQNGESITTKQLVQANSFVRLKVRVEFRKDIVASDLPTSSTMLNLAFTVNYVQSDGNVQNVNNNGVRKVAKVVSGNLDTVGSEICIEEECFYLISSDDTKVTLLSKFNLHVGYQYDDYYGEVLIENPTGKQEIFAKGPQYDYSEEDDEYYEISPSIGIVYFATNGYWNSPDGLKPEYGASYPAYVYDSNNVYLYEFIENYRLYLKSLGILSIEARLISYEELVNLGCSRANSNCNDAPDWVYHTSYWSGSIRTQSNAWFVTNVDFSATSFYNKSAGVRPVIEILKNEIIQ